MYRKSLIYVFVSLSIIVGSYLTIKASNENSWDGWGFGSAQTMNSIEHWVRDGWITHYFLFIPAGYSKVTHYFDVPALRQHAWTEVTGSPGEKRVYYTHFPPGYLFPLALLRELGFQDRFWFRLFQILLSIGSIWLLYQFFLRVSNHWVAFFSASFYLFSVPFLNFADSLANLPIDDFLRFAILFLSVSNSSKFLSNQGHERIRGTVTIWILYFLLSVSSYDSTIFIFVWLVGIEMYTRRTLAQTPSEDKRRALKRLGYRVILFATAPVLAFTLQIAQNSWYLGFSNMTADFLHAFTKIGLSAGSNSGFMQAHFLQGVVYPIAEAFALPFSVRTVFLFCLLVLVAIYLLWKYTDRRVLSTSVITYLLLLCVAGFSQSLIILDNHPYKGRVLGVFAVFLMGTALFTALKSLRRQTTPPSYMMVFVVLIFTATALSLQTQRTFAYIRQWPNNVYNQEKIAFDVELHETITSRLIKNSIQFSTVQPQSYDTNVITATMVSYYDMYYSRMPITYFTDLCDLVHDFLYLKKISKDPFSAVLVTKDKDQQTELMKLLREKLPPSEMKTVERFQIQNMPVLVIF